jgi:hypothetical protein
MLGNEHGQNKHNFKNNNSSSNERLEKKEPTIDAAATDHFPLRITGKKRGEHWNWNLDEEEFQMLFCIRSATLHSHISV